jgi:hypothetical protein
MSTDKNDTNRKAFEADLFQHLLSRTYGQEYSDLILKKSLQQTNDDCTSVNSDKDNAASVASSESGSSIQTQDSILADAVPVQDRSSPSDSTVDPLQYRNQRIRFRIPPHFVQSSPLNEDRVMKPCPVRSIWDLDLRLRYKKPAPIRPRLLKKRSLKVEQRRSAEVNNRGKKREHEDTQDSPFTFTQNKRTMLGAFYEKIIDCLY